MRWRAETLFSIAVLCLFAWTLWEARNWPFQSRLFPLVIGVPMVVLAFAQIVMDLRGVRTRALDSELPTDIDPAVVRRRVLEISGWLVGFLVVATLVGFPLAIPLLILAFLRFAAKERWTLSLGLTAIAGAAFYLVFVQVLNLPFPPGVIQSWLFPDL